MANLLYRALLYPITVLAKLLLFTLGWSPLNKQMFQHLQQNKRIIAVFSHTAYVDFYIMSLYILAYPQELKHIRVLVKPQPFEYAGWLLRRLGAIPATKLDDKNGGAVDRIVQHLQQQEAFLFLISPKGTVMRHEWRSGYYHIAQKLSANLLVVGLDYELHQGYVSTNISWDYDQITIKTFLQESLKEIVPLYPEREVIAIRQHAPPTICNPIWLAMWGCIHGLGFASYPIPYSLGIILYFYIRDTYIY